MRLKTTAWAGLAAMLGVMSGTLAAALELTPAQTEGPFYPTVMPRETDNDLTRVGDGPLASGVVLVLDGTVVDADGRPLAGATIEIWQTDHRGIYFHPGAPRTAERDQAFQFYGLTKTDAGGRFSFRTIEPARYPGRARHIHAKITPAGARTLTTQFYFKDDADLLKDGIARRLGKALESVKLAPVARPDSATAERGASLRVVMPKS